jgi:hypothetical protein
MYDRLLGVKAPTISPLVGREKLDDKEQIMSPGLPPGENQHSCRQAKASWFQLTF